ncbi:Replication protein A 32 kDa subunit A [Platanthera guangdongensis]|uniref:Replication protein A 32 kDa subunit A n=1 Tax=Platanthera guangdongensis TaxID=2320717 RepID=A0ABR2MVU0_9ASPA
MKEVKELGSVCGTCGLRSRHAGLETDMPPTRDQELPMMMWSREGSKDGVAAKNGESAAIEVSDDEGEVHGHEDASFEARMRLVGLVMNRTERATEVSFTLDDGTGRIDITRWIF